MTLRQVANSTRISVMLLEALERGDLSRLPGGIFTRSFIRAYAQEVGLDPDRMIQDFIAELPPESTAATAQSAAMEDGEKLESDRQAVTTAVKLILVSLPIAGFVIYYGLHRAASVARAPVTSAATGGDATLSVLATPAGAPAPAADPIATRLPVLAPASPARPAGLAMEIAPRNDCWVSVTVDGEQLFSGVIRRGDKRQITARDEISLNVGDAGAFAYTLNGKQGRPLGASGEVVSKRITLADARDYVTP